MSASTRTVQQTLGTNRLGAALVALALIILIAVAVAISQLATTKVQTVPAAGTAPVFVDHGSRDEIGPGAALGAAPVNGNVSQYQSAVTAAANAAAPVNGNVSQYQSAVSAAANATGPVTIDRGAHRPRIGGQ
jgi:hypothetical protein